MATHLGIKWIDRALVLVVVAVNSLFQVLFAAFAKVERHDSISTQLVNTAWKTFFLIFLNTAFLVPVFNMKCEPTWRGDLGLTDFFCEHVFIGEYVGFTKSWYENVGRTVVLSVALNMVVSVLSRFGTVSLLDPLVAWCWRDGCVTQTQLNELFQPRRFDIEYRYSFALTYVLCALVYCSGLPVLVPLTAAYFWASYVADSSSASTARRGLKSDVLMRTWEIIVEEKRLASYDIMANPRYRLALEFLESVGTFRPKRELVKEIGVFREQVVQLKDRCNRENLERRLTTKVHEIRLEVVRRQEAVKNVVDALVARVEARRRRRAEASVAAAPAARARGRAPPRDALAARDAAARDAADAARYAEAAHEDGELARADARAEAPTRGPPRPRPRRGADLAAHAVRDFGAAARAAEAAGAERRAAAAALLRSADAEAAAAPPPRALRLRDAADAAGAAARARRGRRARRRRRASEANAELARHRARRERRRRGAEAWAVEKADAAARRAEAEAWRAARDADVATARAAAPRGRAR
ncbi:hypothetical protein JL720_15898 [Aureococcus anophagefferens]|nr:hypothetical protein JL720_15898 [Aureococcus anophagefferens]